MKTALLDKLCCPFDKHDLDLEIINHAKDDDSEIQEGLMTCPECNRYYPIIYGIPIMTPDEYREFALEQPVLKRWEKQLSGNIPKDASFKMLPKGEK
ncbi:MAG TPA: Trm112 family protein [Balneolales bacterium]|nr:Trm112 family protein [Balneolales bacterium]